MTSTHSPWSTRNASWRASAWYIAVGRPGSTTVMLMPKCGKRRGVPSKWKPYSPLSVPTAAESATLTTNQPGPSGSSPASVSTSLASGTGIRVICDNASLRSGGRDIVVVLATRRVSALALHDPQRFDRPGGPEVVRVVDEDEEFLRLGQPQEELDGRRAAHQGEVVVVRPGEVVLLEELAESGEIHERQAAQVQDDVSQAVRLGPEVVDQRGDPGGADQVELAVELDEDRTTVPSSGDGQLLLGHVMRPPSAFLLGQARAGGEE